MYASTWQEGLLSETFGVDKKLFKPLSALLMYGVLDYVIQDEFTAKRQNPMLPATFLESVISLQTEQMQVLGSCAVYDIPMGTSCKQNGKPWKNDLRNCIQSVLQSHRPSWKCSAGNLLHRPDGAS